MLQLIAASSRERDIQTVTLARALCDIGRRSRILRDAAHTGSRKSGQSSFRCPLWVTSGHSSHTESCPLYFRKQTFIARGHVCFSNRPVWVKRFQAIQPLQCRCRLRARASLRTRRQGPSSMGFENEGNNLWVGLTVKGRQVQADMRSHLIHRPARDIIPPRGGARVFSYRL